MRLSQDSLAMLLICTNLAIPDRSSVKPLTPKEWLGVSQALVKSPLKSPKGFFEYLDWEAILGIDADLAMRIKSLLGFGGQLGLELERLEQMGVWVTTRVEDDYPVRIKQILGIRSPLVLFGAGDKALLNHDAVAIVGSRNVGQDDMDFTTRLAECCVKSGFSIVSGGARGVDKTAETAAFNAGGHVISVSAGGFINELKTREYREAVASGKLLLVTGDNPFSRFTVASAMIRNKYVYALSKYAVVVSSGMNEGGTWAGVTENLRADWVPAFVRSDVDKPAHLALLGKGAHPITWADLNPEIGEYFSASSFSLADRVQEDSFQGIYPDLEKYLQTPRTIKEVAEEFKVAQDRAKEWLTEGVLSDKFVKKTKPVRYVSSDAASGEQLSLMLERATARR